MSSPTKPWEHGVPANARLEHPDGSPYGPFFVRTLTPQEVRGPLPGSNLPRNMSNTDERQPPPIPSRPNSVRPFSMYNNGSGAFTQGYGNYGNYNFGGQYSPYGLGSYSSPYSQYGSYSNYGRFGTNSSLTNGNALIRRAEETSRPAFQSIESIVQAFGSITMMLESTFFAVHNSFRAVLGVAEQFHNLKLNILNTVGAYTLWRMLKYCYRRFLVLLGLRTQNIHDDIWGEVASDVSSREARKGAKSWPVLLFFAVVFGTPWLIWKFLNTVVGSLQENEDEWIKGEGEHYVGEVGFDFRARSTDELDCSVGNTLVIAPKDKQPDVRGWLLATTDGKTSGLVPANYVKGIVRRVGKPTANSNDQNSSTESSSDMNTLFEECDASAEANRQ